MARLRKVDVETLLDSYDTAPIAALTVALRRVLDLPDAPWTALLEAAPFDPARRTMLRDGDQRALDELAAELNEQRSLPPGS